MHLVDGNIRKFVGNFQLTVKLTSSRGAIPPTTVNNGILWKGYNQLKTKTTMPSVWIEHRLRNHFNATSAGNIAGKSQSSNVGSTSQTTAQS